MKYRFVEPGDTKAILDIYAQYIDTTITFEYDLPSVSDFDGRIKEFSKDYPYIVAILDNKIVGYAYAHKHKERAAYQWNVEFSIYLDKQIVTKGIGTKMYDILFDIVKLQGIKNVYALVTNPNIPSEKFHYKMGFELLALHKNDGFKNGQWKDVMEFRKNIAAYEDNPAPIKYINQLDKDILLKILESE